MGAFCFDLDVTHSPAAVTRRKVSNRAIRTDMSGTAAECIGAVNPGDEISGVTNGQFSLIDMLIHLARQTGPCDVAISTWTMGIYDHDECFAFVNSGAFRSVRWILDPSFFARNAPLAGKLVDSFGVDAFRGVATHAKFATMRSETLALVIRTSCNLNRNSRMESFDISVDEKLTSFYEDIVEKIFATTPASKRPPRAKALFQDLAEAHRKATARLF